MRASSGRKETHGMGSYPWFNVHVTLYHTHVAIANRSTNAPVTPTDARQGREYHSHPIRLSVLFIPVYMVCVVASAHLVC